MDFGVLHKMSWRPTTAPLSADSGAVARVTETKTEGIARLTHHVEHEHSGYDTLPVYRRHIEEVTRISVK